MFFLVSKMSMGSIRTPATLARPEVKVGVVAAADVEAVADAMEGVVVAIR